MPIKKVGDKAWKISAEQRALLPEVAGNSINGLGETEFRRPDIVYWPNDIVRGEDQSSPHPFAPVISWFRDNTPATTPTYTDFASRAPKVLDPVQPVRMEADPGSWTDRVKDFVREQGADLVGVTQLDPNWFFSELEPADLPWVVMIGCHMDYDKMQHMPPSDADPTSAIEVGEVYNQVDRVAGALANWIHAQGWQAQNQGGPMAGQMVLIPAAIACGFGELGKHGSLINREFGSLVRLSAVRTDLPLLPDAPVDLGVDDFCRLCQACSNACPPDAILPLQQVVRGVEKWYVDFDKCIPYFNENYACGICIAVCPWSRPGVGAKLSQKMLARRKTTT